MRIDNKAFQPYEASTTAGDPPVTTLKVGFTPGYVNLIVPTLGGTALDATTPPAATITVTTWFWLKIVATFGAPDTYVVTVEQTTTATPPAAEAITGTGFTSCLYLAKATVASSVITALESAVSANLGVESYGNINNWWALA